MIIMHHMTIIHYIHITITLSSQWRYPNYSRWDKEKLVFRLIQLSHDSYYCKMLDELRKYDKEVNEIYRRRTSEEKTDAQTNDYVWCMRRNFTPDKWNEDYRF